MNILRDKTITDVPGILAAGISCGIKKNKKKDLCIIYSRYKANSAAVFTNNKVKGAPVIFNMQNINNDNTQAIVANSGNANSCTGHQGLENAKTMADTAASILNLSSKEVLVASTGALGIQLPMDIIIPGIEKACSALHDNVGFDAAEAIMTTDSIPKTITIEFEIRGKKVTMSGMAKGSTMIHPNMGTLLVFITTDANISKELLNKALKASVEVSFNMISIDGDTSTNDMAIIIANGASGHSEITLEGEDFNIFSKALDFICIELAKMIAKDGEGSKKFIEVEVVNAGTLTEARKAARAVVSSTLVKCEMFGSALKWPTIACALGYSGINFNPLDFDIFISNDEFEIKVVKNAIETGFDKKSLDHILSGENIKILIDLKNGNYRATAWGCDLSSKFVQLNAYLLQ